MSLRVSRNSLSRFLLVAVLSLTASVASAHRRAVSHCVHSDAELLAMPDGVLETEIARLRPADFRVPPAVHDPSTTRLSAFEASTQVDLLELGMALDDLKVGDERKADLIDQYAKVRKEIGRRMAQAERRPDTDIPYPIPDGIPAEFSDYLRALLWSHDGKIDDARILWERIESLPPDARRYRGPWAVFMLGRSWLPTNPTKAIGYFQKVRQMIGDGPDRNGLASSSLGWEGMALLNLDRPREAAHLYLQQAWSGDSTAISSVQSTIITLLRPGQDRQELLDDPLVREAITTFILCNGGRFTPATDADRRLYEGWLTDVEARGTKDPTENDRLAWTEYCRDRRAIARTLLEHGDATSAVHRLLTAKLLLADGQVDRAVPILESFVTPRRAKGFPESMLEPKFIPWADGLITTIAADDLHAIYLARGQYTRSLLMLCRAGDGTNGTDLGYVAERLLTAPELKSFVDGLGAGDVTENQRAEIRNILARRLARDGDTTAAAGYFDPEWRAKLKSFADAVERGRKTDLSTTDRAKSLMDAAKICRNEGYFLFGVSFDDDDAATLGMEVDRAEGDERSSKMTKRSDDELKRFAATQSAEKHPYPMTSKAADLAWDAAGLLPDNSAEKLDALYTGGSWLKANDPKAADRFYKAICRHCGSTELGKKCAAEHWFASR